MRVAVEFISLFLAGMLAGEEFVVRYGVRGPLAALDDRTHIHMRQSLIRTLRILVPAIFVPALISAVAAAIVGGAGSTGAEIAFRWAGVLALLVWTVATFFGTVPINEAALDWDLDAPPNDWKASVDRWERLNTVRTWAAVAAFACFVVTAALQVAGK
jgi:uncharacterized membrane protein